MSEAVLVVGTMGLDDVRTPFGAVKSALGGSATYFSVAAGLFAPVNLVSIVGSDFPEEHLEFLRRHNVDLTGLQRVEGATFRWSGSYEVDMNAAETLDTQLNVVESFDPIVPESYRETNYVLLANGPPLQQARVLQQLKSPKLTVLDTMNLWIEIQRDELVDVIGMVDMVTINDGEARLLAGTPSLVRAAREILSMGPRAVLIKRGEAGAVMFSDGGYFVAPAYPLEEVFDPTGAGDSFAGGFMGFLAREDRVDSAALKQGVIYGCAVASFTVEAFSLGRLGALTTKEVEDRYKEFQSFTQFESM